MSFHVGQKVVCVDDKKRTTAGFNRLTVRLVNGQIYEIRDVGLTNSGSLGLRVHGAVLSGEFGCYSLGPFQDAFWDAGRFRPVQTRSTETGIAILRKVADDASKKRNLVTTR